MRLLGKNILINKDQRPYNCLHWRGVDMNLSGDLYIVRDKWLADRLALTRFNFCPKCGLDLRPTDTSNSLMPDVP